MQEHSNAVVFIGCGFPMGGVLFLAHLGVAIAEQGRAMDADVYFAAIDQEGQAGFWEIAEKGISSERIIRAASFASLAEKIVALAHGYSKVLVHTAGGWGQTKRFVQAHRRLDKTLSQRLPIDFIATTHSYRHDSIHRLWMSAFQYVLYRLFFRMVVFQCSDAADRFVGGHDLIRRGMGTVIPLGCEAFAEESLKEPQGRLLDELRNVLDDGKLFKLVYLAAFRPCKNHKWLISSLAPVLRARPQCRLLFCGAGADSVVRRMKDRARELGVERQVVFAGQVDRLSIPYVLAKSNCAVVPTGAETFGHNFLEPMFAGIPVVGTAVGVGREIVRDGETGFRISLKDKQSVRRAVLTLMDNPDLCARMGETARRLVIERYSHKAIAARHIELYKKLLTEA